jgi:membrane fusion protein, multidrug efflux system
MKQHRGKLAFGAGVLILLAVIWLRAVTGTDKSAETKTEQPMPDIKVQPVSVSTVRAVKKTLVKTITATGVAEAIRRVQISARLTAEILDVPAREGAYFRQGQTLLRFNAREYKIALKEAQDDFLKAQSEYAIMKSDYRVATGDFKNENTPTDKLTKLAEEFRRAEERYAKKEIPEKEYLTAKENLEFAELLAGGKQQDILRNRSGLTRAEAALERAKMNVENSVIGAPFNGYPAMIKVSQGQVAVSGQNCMEFVDISRVKIEVGVLERELPRLAVGNACTVTLNAFAGEVFNGKIVTLSPVIALDTKTAKVIIELSNPNGKIKPGMFATVDMDAMFFKDRLVVPRRSVVERDGRSVVFVREGNLAKWNYVKLGESNMTEVEILDGIQPGNEVIVENNFTLSHDMPVSVTNKK